MIWDALHIGKAIYLATKTIPGVSLHVYPLRIPQEIDLTTTPAISYYITNITPEFIKDSNSLCDTVQFTVSVFGATYTGVTAIAQSVRDAMDGLTGETAGVTIDFCRFESGQPDYENETKLFMFHMNFSARVTQGTSTNINTMDSLIITPPIAVTADYTWTEAIPAGYLIEGFMIEETAGHGGAISCGTTLTGTNIFQNETITASSLNVISLNVMISKTAATTIYFNDAASGDAWNSMSLSIYGILRRII